MMRITLLKVFTIVFFAWASFLLYLKAKEPEIIVPLQIACKYTANDQIIDVMISDLVRSYRKFQSASSTDLKNCQTYYPPKKSCVNPFPYVSVEDFKTKNPNCCKVLDKIPGDAAWSTRPNIRGEKYPKMYLIEYDYAEFREGDDGLPEVHRRKTNTTYDCFGKQVYGED
jgi:hypothetical protein